MKIAIPVEKEEVLEKICISFGRTPFFLLYDTVTEEKIVLENPARNSPGGAGIKAAQFVLDNNIEILITPRCGENAAKVLLGDQVKIYKSQGESVKDNLDMFQKNELSILEEIHPGFHNKG